LRLEGQPDLRYQKWLVQLGQQLSFARQEKGWSVEHAARECSLRTESYQMIEEGRLALSTQTLFQIAVSFEIPFDALIPRPNKTEQAH